MLESAAHNRRSLTGESKKADSLADLHSSIPFRSPRTRQPSPMASSSPAGKNAPDTSAASSDGSHILPKDIKSDIKRFQLEGYAKKYFGTHKKGIFKRQVPIKELLTFQKVPFFQSPQTNVLKCVSVCLCVCVSVCVCHSSLMLVSKASPQQFFFFFFHRCNPKPHH